MERLATFKAELTTRLQPVRLLAAQVWASMKPRAARAWAAAKVAWRHSAAFAKRMFIALLIGVEKALLTHKGRERTQAITVFTLIFAFAVTSVDYLLTGGPELSPGARAATYTTHVDLIAPRMARAETTDEPVEVAHNQPAAEVRTAAPAPQPAVQREAVAEPAPKAEPEPSGAPALAAKDKA